MKIVVAALALSAFAQNAFAASPECNTIASTSARLACYDAASPPKIEKTKGVRKGAPQPALKDAFAAEDAKTNAKLKNICRGC
jgi:hypothetical protein